VQSLLLQRKWLRTLPLPSEGEWFCRGVCEPETAEVEPCETEQPVVVDRVDYLDPTNSIEF
jgi:hypothetical protein